MHVDCCLHAGTCSCSACKVYVPGDILFCCLTKELDGKHSPGSCMTYSVMCFVVYKVLFVEDLVLCIYAWSHCGLFNSAPPQPSLSLLQDILAGAID